TCATDPSVPQPCGREALKVLGKALFWDQQVGSDGQACASCHYHAGADNRSKNQLDPGLRNQTPGVNTGAFNDPTGFGPNTNNFGPNYQLTADDFPFHKIVDPNVNPELAGNPSLVLSDTNDIASSQGVFNAAFTAIKIPTDTGTPSATSGPGAIFNVGGVLVRNVEPRNTPTVINTVLNHRNFWDSRARNEFNGTNPIGALDPTARVVKAVPVGPGKPNNANFVQVNITKCSACSQADGPPLSNLEMSFDGRTFPKLGRKMLSGLTPLTPLGQQLVATDDSVLGPYSNSPGMGVNFKSLTGPTSVGKYMDLIKKAFDPAWWDAPGWYVDLTNPSNPVLTQKANANTFTVMEYNFSLYFGLAVNEYEKLLIADNTPFDQFMDGNLAALDPPTPADPSPLRGLGVFLGQGRCINCHSGPELTNASLTNVQGFQILERMIMGNNEVAVYDNGHYNTGVRPTLEDIGIGATIGPKNLPLSNSRFFQQCVQNSVKAGSTIQQANSKCLVPRILARPGEAATLLTKAAALLPAGDPTRTAAEALIQHALDLLALVPPDPRQASCALMYNAVLLCPTTTVTDPTTGTTTTVPVPGAYDLLVAVLPPPADLLAAAQSLLPDLTSPGTAPKLLAPVLPPNERVAVDGAHKTPSVRNAELTAPYFHNGGTGTLEQVVDFYNRGGDFPVTNIRNLDVDIQPLGLSDQSKADLVAFMKALTD